MGLGISSQYVVVGDIVVWVGTVWVVSSEYVVVWDIAIWAGTECDECSRYVLVAILVLK